MRHDQLLKKLLEKFLKDFLELFFPDVAERLDFETEQFLDKELTTDFPRGTTREVDVVARLETHQGEPEIALVHVEVQSRPEKDFARRMFEYSALYMPAWGWRISRPRSMLRQDRLGRGSRR